MRSPWQGYPGRVEVVVQYTLTEAATLKIDFKATSDAATPINLAQHTYFNLDGVDRPRSVLEHRIQINRWLHPCIPPFTSTFEAALFVRLMPAPTNVLHFAFCTLLWRPQ